MAAKARAGDEEGAGQVDGNDVVPHLDRHFVDGGGLEAHAGIVEEEVDAAERLVHRRRRGQSTSAGSGDVAGDGEGLRTGGGFAGFGDRLVEHVLAAADEDRVPALGEQGRGRRLAYARAGAGDDRGLAVGWFRHSVFLPFSGETHGKQREREASGKQKGRPLATAPNSRTWLWRRMPIRLPKMMRPIG